MLWLLVCLLLLRGAADVLAGPDDRVEDAAPAAAAGGAGWPDDQARAFAVAFARAYLEWSPRHPEWHATALRPYLARDLDEHAGLELPEGGAEQTVVQATVAGVHRLGADRALITVQATVASTTVTTRAVAVPVGRDSSGALAVYAYPALAAPPARADVAEDELDELDEPDRTEIQRVLERFFAAYLAGRDDELSYLAPAGARLRALRQRYELRELVSTAALDATQPRRRRVLATLRARDRATGAGYLLEFRVELVRRDRWYVAAVNES